MAEFSNFISKSKNCTLVEGAFVTRLSVPQLFNFSLKYSQVFLLVLGEGTQISNMSSM